MCRPRWAASFVAMLEMWPRLQPTRTEWDASALVWLGFSRQRRLLKGKESLTRPVDHPMPGEREGSAPWLKLRSAVTTGLLGTDGHFHGVFCLKDFCSSSWQADM